MSASPFDWVHCIHCGFHFQYKDCVVVATNQAPESPVPAGTVLHEQGILKDALPTRGLVRLRRGETQRLPEVQKYRYRVGERGPTVQGSVVLAELACPNPDCHTAITAEKEWLIALVGASASGKSHYIASLVDQVINAGTLAGFRSSSHARGDSYERYTQHYFNPLVKRKEAIQLNKAGRDAKNAPLSFTLVLDQPGQNSPRRFTFSIFDWQGEMLVNAGQRAIAAKYVTLASAMIFFVDPMILPGVIDYLPERLRGRSVNAIPIGHTISSVVEGFNRKRGFVPDTRPLDIPVSIMMSKSDIAIYPCKARGINPRFLQDERHLDGYDIRRAREVSREVRDFLVAMGADDVMSREGLLRKVMYHAVSATGYEEINNAYSGYRPIRCLDPFLWIVSQWGLFP